MLIMALVSISGSSYKDLRLICQTHGKKLVRFVHILSCLCVPNFLLYHIRVAIGQRCKALGKFTTHALLLLQKHVINVCTQVRVP